MLHRRAFQEPISKAGAKTARARVEEAASICAAGGAGLLPGAPVAGKGRAARRVSGFAKAA